MEKGIRYAYFLGLARALRHIPLILLKLLVNLVISFAMIAPLRKILHNELDSNHQAGDLVERMDYGYFSHLVGQNEGAWDAMAATWWPLVILLMVVNVYLSGGILETIQRSDRAGWREIFRACRVHFLPLVLTIALSLVFAIVVVIIPLAALDAGLGKVEGMADPQILVWSFWIAVLIGVLLLIYAMTQIATRFESNRFGRATFVIAVLALSAYGLFNLFGFIRDIEHNHPDQLLSYNAYWFGFILIMGLGGTWAIRIYHYTRLLVCRPYRDPDAGRLSDTVGQFFQAIGFTLRYYARTFWIWAFFTISHLALFYIQKYLYATLDINSRTVGFEFGMGQLFLGLHITFGIGMAGAFIIFLWSQDGMPHAKEPAKKNEPEEEAYQESEDLPWMTRAAIAEEQKETGETDEAHFSPENDAPEREWVEPIVTGALPEENSDSEKEPTEIVEPIKGAPIVVGMEQAAPIIAQPAESTGEGENPETGRQAQNDDEKKSKTGSCSEQK